ncbi:cbb3-type cytochrome c oxidase subunit 3 [Halomonas denitrificans]|uniref:cbb3-type cytochrome oxidase subunit 3 n=1 Tax=Halomonas TaxID=2745 RepID=UPI001A8FEB54|nr:MULTISPECIES: cbb3-type cytochrome c oxidase subunit 3 [Halomonas]MED5296509.1 cbb3-type cytochrome c oxidase subunit 3 [Pseudomonadota bacterium]MBN8412361.1 cbb3-type cytochrome c oxidase subunit 3 [Halomonas litopenaei]MBY5924637.1 cbb3-type cytochrome c oxidase subunit 3 [Halomonas sp. DP4Y7-2]MBY5929627.1 cbb3-type cytochrome c oxidase subunit 3 [Halomonas sp. DP8Y7-3]MBY5968598.1 cbb3-type cytochrome c oxidase subunit 3 [Halomonas denitrificans]
MDIGTFRGILTGILLVAFLGLVAWAYSSRRKREFEQAANLPFADDDEQPNRDRMAEQQADSRKDRGEKNT